MPVAPHVHSSFIGIWDAYRSCIYVQGHRSHIALIRTPYIGTGFDYGTSVLRRVLSKRLSSPGLDVINEHAVTFNKVSSPLQNPTKLRMVHVLLHGGVLIASQAWYDTLFRLGAQQGGDWGLYAGAMLRMHPRSTDASVG